MKHKSRHRYFKQFTKKALVVNVFEMKMLMYCNLSYTDEGSLHVEC